MREEGEETEGKDDREGDRLCLEIFTIYHLSSYDGTDLRKSVAIQAVLEKSQRATNTFRLCAKPSGKAHTL